MLQIAIDKDTKGDAKVEARNEAKIDAKDEKPEVGRSDGKVAPPAAGKREPVGEVRATPPSRRSAPARD